VRWFLSTESQGVKRLSLALAVVSALYGMVTHGPRTYQYLPPNPIWWEITFRTVVGILWFLAAWIPVRLIAWIVSGFRADRVRKSSN